MFLLKIIHIAKERYSTFMVFYALSNFPHFHIVYLVKVGLFYFPLALYMSCTAHPAFESKSDWETAPFP